MSKVVVSNRKAYHKYEFGERYEAGIVLKGDEIKSVRKGSVSLADAFVIIRGGEAFLINMYIAPYSHAYSKAIDPRRPRKLLLHKRELKKLTGIVAKKGVTLVPTKLYFNRRGFLKVEVGVAKNKSNVSKKKELIERELSREASRELKKHRHV